MQQGSDCLAGALFAALLCMKHLFLFCGPLYFAHILGHWCTGSPSRACVRFLLMAATVAAVIGTAVGPFLWMGQAAQVGWGPWARRPGTRHHCQCLTCAYQLCSILCA